MQTLLDKAYRGTVVNWTLPTLDGRSFEITLTVPLRVYLRINEYMYFNFYSKVEFL